MSYKTYINGRIPFDPPPLNAVSSETSLSKYESYMLGGEVGMRALVSLLAVFCGAVKPNGVRIQRINEWFKGTPEESWDLWHDGITP